MLINQQENEQTAHVKFISYTGKWPNLCSGILTLEIDKKRFKFGQSYIDNTVKYPKFWHIDGDCSSKSEWLIDVKELPREFVKYAAEIDHVFNKNVEHGHCGGCK